MANEIAQKPPPSSILVRRFKALLRRRHDDLTASSAAPAPPPTAEEIVRIYKLLLSELSSNVKPIITDLTIVAEQQRQHAKGIADAISDRILEVPADQKLPSLYLLDNIVKNLGQEYVRYFSLRLPEVFSEAYRKVKPNLHSAMRCLFGTWSKVFPPSVLCKIEAQLQFSRAINNQPCSVNPLRASESPRPTNGTHVNPKYLRQMEHTNSIMDSCPPETEILQTDKMHSDRVLVSSSHVGGERLDPTGTVGNTNCGLVEWQQKQFHGDGHPHQSPRALIDAYGTDKSHDISSSKPLLVEWVDRNGIENKVLSTSWQNTEEEEFDWEDMNPLVDHSRYTGFLRSTISFSRERPVLLAVNATSLEQETRKGGSGGSQLHLVDDSSVIAEDAFPSSAYGHVSLGQVSVFQNQINQNMGSGQHLDIWKISNQPSNSSQYPSNIRGRVRNLLMPPIDNLPNTDVNPYGTRPTVSRIVPGLKSNMKARLPVSPAAFEMRPSVNVHITRPPSLNSIFPLPERLRSQFEAVNANDTNVGHGPNKSLFMHEQSSDSVENKDINKGNLHRLPNLPGVISSNWQNRGQAPQLQFLPSQGPASSKFSHGSSLQGHGAAISTPMSNPLPVMQFPLWGQSIASVSLHLQGGALPPSLPGHPLAPSQMIPHPNASAFVTSQQPTGAYSNLISSLMTEGVISLTNQPPGLDSVGTEFDPDILKFRHESAVSALYGDLPRQCTTCGLRFKCQDNHSSHMDWHVTKNRMSKNHKQKPPRKWFVGGRIWLSGAEALRTESIPDFLPTETMEEKKDDVELAVPAEEDQSTCALCGEPFDEFYSDEMEEWMYRGAVYLNAPKGPTAGMIRSQLGPIIHAKCRSESSMAQSEEFGLDEGGTYEEASQRKRMRVD